MEVWADNLTKEQANRLEKYLINSIGRRDLNEGSLVNMTGGGDGGNQIVVSEETRQKLRDKTTGVTRSQETKDKISKWSDDNNTKKPVLQLNASGDAIGTFKNIYEAARLTGIDRRKITRVCAGKGNQTGGFYWKYAQNT